jgi:hypothetical protein
VTTPSSSSPLPPDLLARDQAAQVATDEANARKAAADASTSALTLAQTQYKSLVPDLTGVSANAVTDKSAGVAFSGLVTYSALNHAAEMIASRVSAVLGGPGHVGRPTILVTSQSDLLSNDLLAKTVATSLNQLVAFADQVLAEPETADQPPAEPQASDDIAHRKIAGPELAGLPIVPPGAELSAGAGAPVGLGLVGGGPVGLAAAVAAGVPAIISLFSSTTTVKDHAEDITDLATTTSVVAAVADKLDGFTVVHEDFRLAPQASQIRTAYQQLAEKRAALAIRQEAMQATKNKADLEQKQAEQKQDAAKKASPPTDDPGLTVQVARALQTSADAAAELTLISGTIASIDAFNTAVNATAAGTRSPLALASLNELLHQDAASGDSDSDAIGYVLSVKGLSGQSEEYTKDRHVSFDTYTTLADAAVAFMLYDLAARKIIKSGIANGVSSVHGRLGHPPTGLVGPNTEDATDDLSPGATPEDHQAGQPEHRKHHWRLWFGPAD